MSNICNCIGAIKNALNSARTEARRAEFEYTKSLDMFKGSITDGATERISRTLFKAGVYQTSLQRNLRKDFGANEIVRTLESILTNKKDSELITLHNFVLKNSEKILEQQRYVDPAELLKRILSNKKKAEGLLQINYDREILAALSSMKRLNKLKTQLDTWKENARLQEKVQYIAIVDMH